MAIWLGVLFIGPDVLQNRSIGSRLYAVAFTLVVVAICDLWFSRRMGITVNEKGITLHGAFFRKHLRWADIQGFEWKRWRDPRIEWLWILTTQDARIRIPTIQRGARQSHYFDFFGSSQLRSKSGEEVDAARTLKEALAAAQKS